MSDNIPTSDNKDLKKTSRHLSKPLKIILWCLGGIVVFIVAAIIGVSLYLTPKRLAEIVSKEASANMKADLKVDRIKWTLWSSFPYLNVDIDTLTLTSRSLENIPSSLRGALPEDASRLITTGQIKGGINIVKALKGDIVLHNIAVANPSVNLVSINDSLSNFNILPAKKKKPEMPDISIDKIEIGRPIDISFRGINDNITLHAILDQLNLSGKTGEKNNFHALISALIDFKSSQYSFSTPLPVKMEGDIAYTDNSKTLTLSDFNLGIANISALINSSVNLDKEPTITALNVDTKIPDLLALLPLVPKESLPAELDSIRGFIPLSLKANLLAPYNIAAAPALPAISLETSSEGGNLSFPISKNQTLFLSGLGLDASLLTDPRNPASSRFDLSDLRMVTDGTSLHINGGAYNLLSGNPDISLALKCEADLDKATKKLLPNSPMDIKGNLQGSSSLSCKLADLSKKQLKDVKLDGLFKVAALSLNDAASRLSARLSDFSLELAASVPTLATSSLTDGKLRFLTSVGHAEVKDSKAGLNATLDNADLSGKFGAKGSISSPVAAGQMLLTAGVINAEEGKNALLTKGVELNLNASLRQMPFSPSTYYPANPTSLADSATGAEVKHTPLYLTASIPPMMQTILSLADMKANVKVREGKITTEAYPADNRFAGLNMNTNLDTLTISSLHLRTRGTSGDISGRIDGLRSFLMASSPVPLKVALRANLDYVDINQLSGNYFRGVELLTGNTPQFLPAPLGNYTAADSLCVALPRNLSVDARLSSRSARYMQYSFAPLSTGIVMNNGTAALKNLRVGTPYCDTNIDWTYSTENLDSIAMGIKAKVDDFNFDDFKATYPELIASAPQLNNLSGDVRLNVDGNFIMTPDMFIDAPSMEGDVNLSLRNFAFVRDKKTLHYTHLMLIKGDGPIRIDSLDIHSAMHDNLLQLDPFTLDCGGYKLLIGGVNNLKGEMYYHLGLLHNPFHLPFGVNLVGTFKHPSIRFGGRWIKDGRERKIAAELGSDIHVNIMRNLRYGWLLFVGNAAKYDFSNNSGAGSDVR
ncbi:MAG: hypothetical protein K2K58_07495 [Muribaculaceae bacterium]|nr:hypothetical protein [Muribaculaceae bacterium]